MPLARKRPEDKSMSWQPTRSLVLHLDDIADILAVMRNVSDTILVETDDFTGPLDDPIELKEIGGESLPSLILTTQGADDQLLQVRLRPGAGTLIIPGDDLGLVGAAEKIHELLRARRTRTGGLSGLARVVNTITVAAVLGATLVFLGLQSLAVAVTVAAALYVGARVLFGPNPTPSARTALAYRNEAPSWWRRNRNAVLVGLLTNALAGAVFYVLGRWHT